MEYELKLFLSFKIKAVELVNGGADENHSLVVNPSSFQQLHVSVPLYLPLHAGKWQSISLHFQSVTGRIGAWGGRRHTFYQSTARFMSSIKDTC